jgi:DNA-binding GntR family transcriptional regulator
MRQIARSRLRDDIVDQLAELIVDGELPEVGRLKEIDLAGQLGVSRTPLREALLILERDGLVVSEANKGFRVAPLSEERVRELFPILATLEALAVRTGSDALVARASELRAVNKQIRAGSGGKRYLLDRRFHELLWTGNANHTLVAMLRRLWLEAKRFDGSTARGMANPTVSMREHAAVADAIGRGELDLAAKLVDAHWCVGIDVVIGWLRDRRRAP